MGLPHGEMISRVRLAEIIEQNTAKMRSRKQIFLIKSLPKTNYGLRYMLTMEG